MKKTLLEEIERIHLITYGSESINEQFLDKIKNNLGVKKIDEPKKADLVNPIPDDLYNTLEDAAQSGGLSEQKLGSMVFQKAVESLQIGLILLGYELPRYGVDGLFGPETASAVVRFKQSNNIPSDNTQVTPETIDLLVNQLKNQNISSQDIIPLIDKTVSNNSNKTSQVINFFVNKGLTSEQGAGIAGNLDKESRLNPNAVGDNGKAYGLAQWRDERLNRLKKFNQNYNNFNVQLEFIWYELNTTENKAFNALKATKTPQEAASVFAKYYERPYSKNYQERETLAQNMYQNYETSRV